MIVTEAVVVGSLEAAAVSGEAVVVTESAGAVFMSTVNGIAGAINSLGPFGAACVWSIGGVAVIGGIAVAGSEINDNIMTNTQMDSYSDDFIDFAL